MLLKYDCITEETANLSPTELYLTYRFDHELNHEPYCNGCKSPNVLSNMIGFAKNHGISLDLSKSAASGNENIRIQNREIIKDKECKTRSD